MPEHYDRPLAQRCMPGQVRNATSWLQITHIDGATAALVDVKCKFGLEALARRVDLLHSNLALTWQQGGFLAS